MGPDPPPPLKSQKYRVSFQYWSWSPKKSQSYQVSISCWAIIGQPAKRHLNGVSWPADDGPYIAVFGSYIPSSLKKPCIKFGPPLTTFSGSTHDMTLPSADHPFKQFGPRLGLTFCPDQIGVQTVWHFRGYDKLKLNRCIFNFALNLSWHCHLLIIHFKQIGPRSGSTFCPDLIRIQTFDTLEVMTSWSWTDVFLTLR